MKEKSTRICYNDSTGFPIKKIAHRLEKNVSQLVTEALLEYFEKRGIKY
ncbi:hypothetical protein NIES4101_83620 [Calothrix sp. NIES-4101]|nr:hypothetical protein NIES4101_83620 [Calothrix sp. NIES-4101]